MRIGAMKNVGSASGGEARWTGAAVLLVLVGVPLLFFFDVLFLDRALVTSSQDLVYPWAYEAPSGGGAVERSFRWDATLNYYPRRYLARESLARGELPLWNPHAAGGMPLLADFQSAVYYPPNLVLNLGDPLRAMGWAVFLHVVLAGLGTYGFLRLRGLPRSASLFGGVVYMLNGFIMTRIGHPTMGAAASWLPWLLLVADRVVACGRGRWFVGLSVVVALSVLSGFPQITIHSIAALVLYLAYRGVAARIRLREGVWILVFVGVGIALSGLQVIPTYEFARQSGRMAEALITEVWHTPVASYTKLVAPELIGNPVDGTNWIALFKGPQAHSNDVGLVAYVGVLPLVLSLAAVGRFLRDGEVRFFSLLAVLVVLGSVFRPVFSALYLFFPGAGAAQADRLAFLLSFCLAFLGARGLALLSEGPTAEGRRVFRASLAIVLGVGGALGALVVGGRRLLAHLASTLSPAVSTGLWDRPLSPRVRAFLEGDLDGWCRYELAQLQWPAVFLGAACVLLLIWRFAPRGRSVRWLAIGVAAVDLVVFARAYYTPQPLPGLFRVTPGIRLLLSDRSGPFRIVRAFSDRAFPSNVNSVYGVDDAQGYNALMVDRYGRLFDLLEPGSYAQKKKIDAPEDAKAFLSPILDLLNVKYVLAEGNRETARFLQDQPAFSGPRLEPVHSADLLIYRNGEALPRAFWLPGARFCGTAAEVAYAMTRSHYDPALAVLLEDGLAAVPWWARAGGGKGRAELRTCEPRRVVVQASSEGTGWFRWAETDYPGWRVEVDGAEVRSWRSDFALRTVPVPAGSHRIELTMDPASVRVGWGLGLFSLVLLVLFGLGIGPRPDEA